MLLKKGDVKIKIANQLKNFFILNTNTFKFAKNIEKIRVTKIFI